MFVCFTENMCMFHSKIEYVLLKICACFTLKNVFWQADLRSRGRAAGIKNPFGGGVGGWGWGFGARNGVYVRWNRLDTSEPIENHLLEKVALLLK